MKLFLALSLAAAILSGCGGSDRGGGSAGAAVSPLRAAYDACVKTEQKYLTHRFHQDAPYVTDEMTYQDGSVLITTPEPQGDYLAAAAFHAAECVLDHTKAPPSITQAMGAATALTGRQRDTYASVRVGWSFNGTSPSSFEASFDPR